MIFDDLPKISCVLVTAGRVAFVQQSVHCYLQQTYKNKELVVVSQGDEQSNLAIKRFLDSLDREDIQYVDAPVNLTLGQMRNLSVELSLGELICQWDDDDFYHPSRLLTQFRALKSNTRSVASLYTQHLKYFVPQKVLYWLDWADGAPDYINLLHREPSKQFLCGSVMFRKDCFHHYKNLLYPPFGTQSGREEDLSVLQKLMGLGDVVSVKDGCQYVYAYHGANVYDLSHHQRIFHKKKVFDREQLLEKKALIMETLRSANVKERVDVCTTPLVNFDKGDSIQQEIVFTYDPLTV